MTSEPSEPRRRASAPRRAARRQAADTTFLAVGRVLRPQGVRGELRLEIQTGFPGHLAEVETVYVGDSHAPHRLESSRFHSGVLVVKLEGYDDRTRAEALRGEVIYVAERDAAPLQPGQFFYHQLIGLPVVSDAGEALGTVTEILATGANDVYVVTGPGGELLLPAIKSVILNIEPGQITVHLVEGLR